MVVGLVPHDQRRDVGFCFGHGWGLHCSNYGSFVDVVSSTEFKRYGLPVFEEGSFVRFIVNKIEKKILVSYNCGNPRVLYEDVDLPEKLKIAVARGLDLTDIELTRFVQHPVFEYDEKEVEKEEEHRLSAIVESYGDILIPFKSGQVNLWKTFLLNSSIPDLYNQNMTEFNGCLDLDIKGVCEHSILRILLGKTVKFGNLENVIDYYLLFRSLGLKREMNYVVSKIQWIENFYECAKMFRLIVSRGIENEVFQTWTTDNPKVITEITIDTFITSLSVSLFHSAKQCVIRKSYGIIEENDEEGNDLLNSPFYEIFLRHVHSYSDRYDFRRHSDFRGIRGFHALTFSSILQRLYRGKDNIRTSNLTLVSTDGVKFLTHRELLVLRFSYFKSMLDFDGVERQSMTEKGEIEIHDMDSKCLKVLLDFVYFGQSTLKCLKEEQVDVLIQIMLNSQKYMAPVLFQSALVRFTEVIVDTENQVNLVKVMDILTKVGYLLYENFDVSKFVIPRLIRYSGGELTKEKALEAIKKSFDEKYKEI